MSQECIHISGLSKSIGGKQLFHDADLSINSGDRIGVIGRNGAGKSTLFRIINGQVEADDGEIQILPGFRLGVLEQDAVYEDHEVVVEFLERYAGVHAWEVYRLAKEFGLSREMLDGKIEDLSGGYRMRMMLVGLLIQSPDILLLDEPTNYMDLSTIIALETFLQNWSGTVLVISHDREFLRRVSHQTLEVESGRLTLSQLPLDEYFVWKAQEVSRFERENVQIEKKQEQLQRFVDRFGAKATKASQAKSKEKTIARLEQKKHTIYRPDTSVRMHIPEVSNKQRLAVTFDEYFGGYEELQKILRDVSLQIYRGDKVVVVGNNGEGKSTFLRGILGQLPYTGGDMNVNQRLRIGYYSQFSADALPLDQTIFEYARHIADIHVSDQGVRDLLGSFLFSADDGDKLIGVLSGGERSRVALLTLFLQKFDVYILDEPSNHLDVQTSEILALSLKDFSGTVIVVSHDRTFVDLLDPIVYEVRQGYVQMIPGSYQEYIETLFAGEAQFSAEKEQSDSSAQDISEQKKIQKELFSSRKQQKKLEESIRELELELAMGVFEAQAKLWEKEELWVRVSEHIERLEEEIG